jgi:hypothetical protein
MSKTQGQFVVVSEVTRFLHDVNSRESEPVVAAKGRQQNFLSPSALEGLE